MIADGNGIPLALTLTGGNLNDVTQSMPLLHGTPPVRARRGRPRQRPKFLYADRGYDHNKNRRLGWAKGVKPLIARRGTSHGPTRRHRADEMRHRRGREGGTMRELGSIYGLHSFDQWERRLQEGDLEAMRDLSDTQEPSGGHRIKEVYHFTDLIDIAAFLAVMNKNLILAFRGQPQDHSLLPTLFRSHWSAPIGDGSYRVRIDDQRGYYWKTLKSVEQATLAVLRDEGLPRWRHLMDHPPALWAVIQHYELWPTPLLDFSTSLRVASSFAFNCHRDASGGYLYVVGLRRIRSDLMTLADNDDAEREAQLLAIRLNAVCPPKAKRPHLQEGVLLGHYPFRRPNEFSQHFNDASSILIAKLRLINQGDFWTEDFPMHSSASLLPEQKDDGLLRKLRERVNYQQTHSGRIMPDARP